MLTYLAAVLAPRWWHRRPRPVDLDALRRSLTAASCTARYGPYERHRDAFVATGDPEQLAKMIEHVRCYS